MCLKVYKTSLLKDKEIVLTQCCVVGLFNYLSRQHELLGWIVKQWKRERERDVPSVCDARPQSLTLIAGNTNGLNLPGRDFSSSCGFVFQTTSFSYGFIATPGHVQEARCRIYDVALAILFFISRLKIALRQACLFFTGFWGFVFFHRSYSKQWFSSPLVRRRCLEKEAAVSPPSIFARDPPL